MNKTIKFLMLSDIFVLTGFGLTDPIIAIFLKENLVGGTILAAGIASSLFMIVKSLVQLPFSKYVDKYGDWTDLKWLFAGTFIVALVPFIYIFSSHIYMIYLAEILHGIGAGLAYPAWLGLWSTHLDRHKESFEWSLYSTLVGIGTSASALVGALVAEYLGFNATFVIVGGLSMLGCYLLMFLILEERKHLSKLKTVPVEVGAYKKGGIDM